MQAQTLLYGHFLKIIVIISSVLLAIKEARVLRSDSNSSDLITTKADDMCSSMSSSAPVLLQAVFRHGDRSPVHSYPTDLHLNDWPQGLGQLTKRGMRQAYELGIYFKDCYPDLVGPAYHREKVTIRSTDFDRALMTAECVAAGLYPLNSNNTPESFLENWPMGQWQPIPIHSQVQAHDALMRPQDSCDYVHELNSGAKAKRAMNKGLINNKDLMIKLTQYTGMDINTTSLRGLADNVFCQHTHNMSRPAWLTDDLEKILIDYYMDVTSINREVAKVTSGTLLLKLFNNMVEKAKNPSISNKIHLFSGHDSTLQSLMSLLGVFNDIQVPYTATFIVELHVISSQPYVRMLYRNGTQSSPLVLTPVGCDKELCPLYHLVNSYRSYVLTKEEWETICGEKTRDDTLFDLKQNSVPIMVAFLVALIGLIGFLTYKVYSYRKQIHPESEGYAALKGDLEGSSDSEAEIYSVNETSASRNGRKVSKSAEKSEEEYDDMDKNKKLSKDEAEEEF